MRYIYSKIITLFNYYESATTGDAYWYPHVLSGVDLITDHGAILKKYGPDSTDNAALHIAYAPDGDKVMVQRSDGSGAVDDLKAWAAQVNDELPDSITFGPEDFSGRVNGLAAWLLRVTTAMVFTST